MGSTLVPFKVHDEIISTFWNIWWLFWLSLGISAAQKLQIAHGWNIRNTCWINTVCYTTLSIILPSSIRSTIRSHSKNTAGRPPNGEKQVNNKDSRGRRAAASWGHALFSQLAANTEVCHSRPDKQQSAGDGQKCHQTDSTRFWKAKKKKQQKNQRVKLDFNGQNRSKTSTCHFLLRNICTSVSFFKMQRSTETTSTPTTILPSAERRLFLNIPVETVERSCPADRSLKSCTLLLSLLPWNDSWNLNKPFEQRDKNRYYRTI